MHALKILYLDMHKKKKYEHHLHNKTEICKTSLLPFLFCIFVYTLI